VVLWLNGSVVNKDLSFKAKTKAKAKDLAFKAKAKDLTLKAKDLAFKAKVKDLTSRTSSRTVFDRVFLNAEFNSNFN